MIRRLVALASAAVICSSMLFLAGTALAANQAANLDQCANDPAPSPPTNGCSGASGETGWVNGNLGPSKSIYREGDSIAYRMRFTNLATSGPAHTVIIEWDTTKAGKHAIDYLTTWNRTVANANPLLGVSPAIPGSPSTRAIPVDPQVKAGPNGTTPNADDINPGPDGTSGTADDATNCTTPSVPCTGVFTMWGGTITSVSNISYSDGTGFAGDKSARLTVSFTASVGNPVLAWGGHIATRQNWPGASAINISGSPYHMRLIDLDGAGGNQDRSLSADAVVFPATVTIIKHSNAPSSQVFAFTTTGGFVPSTFNLTDSSASSDPSQALDDAAVGTGITTFGTYTVAETAITGWDAPGRSCTDTTTNGGSAGATSGNAQSITIDLREGDVVVCTFTNSVTPAPSLSVTKVDDVDNYDSIGDVINYTITVTNTGNVPLTNVAVTDTNAVGLDCDPVTAGNQTTGFSIAVGGHITCTASHTVTQADINAGHYYNQACADDGTGGAASACGDVDTPGVQSPSLSVTKVDDVDNYDSIGDVINYTITVTNTGNVPLTNVAVTDTNAVGLDCDPVTAGNQTTGFSIAVGGHITCTASHTVTQADINAGHYYNQACADDGTGGAASACGDVDTPGVQSPSLSVTKVDDVDNYDSIGDVINYTITVTNTGNVPLTNVAVTDTNAVGLDCDPVTAGNQTTGFSIAVGGHITCTASHTVTQADINAGHYYNQACADDGTGGAASACGDVDTPGVQSPSLSVTKVDDVDNYDSIGDVINYTITVTNTGNVPLTNVAVTDTNAVGLDCDPVTAGNQTTGFSIAVGGHITCTASHTVTQADINAGHYYNQACADDGTGGAASACGDVDTPGVQSAVLSLTKEDDLNPAKFEGEGVVITFTITATNDGNVTLHNVTVSDDPALDDFSCEPALPVASLEPGDSIVCTGTHTTAAADVTAGFFKDTASASSDEDDAPDADDTVYGKAQPTITTADVLIPQDSITLGGLTADATGTLYVELRIDEDCGAANSPAYSKSWTGADFTGNGTYDTDNTVEVSADATIRWCTSYSGDDNNAARPLDSRDEVVKVDFDPVVTGAAFGFAIPLVLWVISRRRKADVN